MNFPRLDHPAFESQFIGKQKMQNDADFFFQTTRGHYLKKIIKVISQHIPDGNIMFEDSRLKVVGLTSDSIALELELPMSNLDSYLCNIKHLALGVDFRVLSHWLSNVQGGDVMSLTLPKDELKRDTPDLLFKHWNQEKLTEVKLPILRISETRLSGDGDIQGPKTTLAANQFESFVRHHGAGIQDVGLLVTPNGLNITSKREDRVQSEGKIKGAAQVGPYHTKVNQFRTSELFTVAKTKCIAKMVTVIVPTAGGVGMFRYNLENDGVLMFRMVANKSTEDESKRDVEPDQPESPCDSPPKPSGTYDDFLASLDMDDDDEQVAVSQKCGICNEYITDVTELVDTELLPKHLQQCYGVHRECFNVEADKSVKKGNKGADVKVVTKRKKTTKKSGVKKRLKTRI